MRIVTYPHDMNIGGSQLNAIELAARVRDLGHEVIVYGQAGPLVEAVAAHGLEFIESPAVHRRPTPGIVHGLRTLVRRREVDIVHGYEWPPTLEAVLACRGRSAAVAVSTVLSMSVAPFIPANVPLLVGTEQIADAERTFGRARVELMEPPVDTALNRPDLDPGLDDFRRQWDLDGRAFTVSIVSRLAHEMKLEGILTAIEAVAMLDGEFPVQLVIAGTGPAAPQVRDHAQRVNRELGRRAIVLTGELADPRPAYAVADVSIGMGGSALRAMAFGKPLIVQGENGYWRVLAPESLPQFLWQGWYGSGPGPQDAARRLAGHLRELRDSRELRERLGRFARDTVCDRFSLDGAAGRLTDFYLRSRAVRDGAGGRLAHAAVAGGRFTAYNLGRMRWPGGRRPARDDFNAVPVAAGPVPATPRGRS
ncbi:glycosyltransferase [Specibacter cremeus]|uniref:glycosyltransferase n=1 Tax=Specibacter cremeus TaxID=1629051 RepID=UPI000F77C311|nr:glycosyltransferase [Specibacter cremeus]